MEWFRQVYRWRSGASAVWSVLLNIPILIVFKVLFSLLGCEVSRWFPVYMVLYLFTLVIIQLVYSVTASANFSVYKTRFQKIWNCVCPTHLFVHFIFVSMATASGTSLLKLAGFNLVVAETIHNDSVQSSITHHLQLNTSYLMTILYCGYLGLVYSCRYFKDMNYILIFPVIQQRKIFRLKGHFRSSLKTSILYCAKSLWPFLLFYILFGHYFKRVVEIVYSLKPSDHTMLSRVVDIFSIQCLSVMMLCGVILHLSWSWGLKLFRVYQTQAIQFPVLPVFSNESQSDLLLALNSSNHLLKHLGFLDLCQLAECSSVRRKKVFSLNQSGGPAMWPDVQKHCLSLVDTVITDLGGNTFDSTTSSLSGGNAFSEELSQSANKVLYPRGWSTQVNEPGLLRRRDVISEKARLWSHGSIVEAETMLKTSSKVDGKKKKAEEQDIKKMLNNVKRKVLEKLKKKRFVAYFISELPGVAEVKAFSNSQLIVWSISALSQLIVASYTEDSYGVVQQDLQLCIVKLIHLLQLLDKKVVHLLSKTRPTDKMRAIEVNGKYAVKSGTAGVAASAAITGLQLILHTFRDIRFLHLSQEQINICRKLQLM